MQNNFRGNSLALVFKTAPLFLFPLIFLSAIAYTFRELIYRNRQGILLFLIFGLPIYTTSLSIALQEGFGSFIPFIQPIKEILILATVGLGLWEYRGAFRMHLVDYAVVAYFLLTFLYVLLPIGTIGMGGKLIAFKSTTFFLFVYLAGRLIKIHDLYVSKYFHYILVVIIAATLVLFYEKLTDQHFQVASGYADFNFYFFNMEPSGDFGLTWTFQASSGLKRFASFFANPLEFAAATLLTLSVIAGLYTNEENKIKLNALGLIAVISTQFAIFFALSRSSLASYFIMIFAYAWITKNNIILKTFYAVFALAILYFILFLFIVNPDLYDWILGTITFTNASSVGHVVAWLEGLDAIVTHPMGLGLGESGLAANAAGGGTGGENQFLIIGVQTGVVALTLYITIYVSLIIACLRWLPKLTGKERKVCMALLMMKIGFIIPLFTSELESSMYISYIVWFFSGVFISIISDQKSTVIEQK